MCLALPGKLEQILATEADHNPQGQVSYDGVLKTVDLSFVPEAKNGDYLIVHAGFAISILDEDEAQASLQLFQQLQAQEQETDA